MIISIYLLESIFSVKLSIVYPCRKIMVINVARQHFTTFNILNQMNTL